MQKALARGPVQRARPVCDERHRDRRRQGEAGPGRERAEIACAHEADGEADLAARRSGQELAERDEIAEGPLVEPAALDDERVAEIAEMRHRPAEAGQAEFEEHAEDFEGRASRGRAQARARSRFVIEPRTGHRKHHCEEP